MLRRTVLVLGISALGIRSASAVEIGKFRFDPNGKVRAVRTVDVNGDRRVDLVLLVERSTRLSGAEVRIDELVVLTSPATPTARTFWPDSAVKRIPCIGDLARAGAVAPGRFGPKGAARLRFLGPDAVVDLAPDGARDEPTERTKLPTLFARSAGRELVFWDAHADLDPDGVEEVWFPEGGTSGTMRVLAGTPSGDRRLDFEVANTATTTPESVLVRTAYVPNLVPADLEGDGRLELVALEGKSIVGWSLARPQPEDGSRLPPSFRLDLPFLDEGSLAPEEIRTPRMQIADVDGDRASDLLVTLVTGRRDQLGSLRTTLFHFPGPLATAKPTSVSSRVRIDTESVTLHPRFVDLDGDGALDYVSDSIRGTKLDLFRRVMGAEPEITFVGFRFDRARKTFESTPYFTITRPYSSPQAVSNTFGQSAWFDGDFDGDRHRDLFDLGNLTGLEIAGAVRKDGAGPGDPVSFVAEILPRTPVPKPLAPNAVVADLTGDGRADAVVWNEETVFVVVSGPSR